MKLSTISLFALAHLAAATPDPVITLRAELQPRQNADPSLVGWISTSGASAFSDVRSCDFPATLSSSGDFAQCCGTSSACNFFTTCNGNILQAESTSVTCDIGICNTGVILESAGASKGLGYLGCWQSSLGEEPFTLIQDIGSAPIATPTGDSSSEATSGASTEGGSRGATATRTSAAESSGSETEAAAQSSSSGAAVMSAAQPLTGIFGAVAMLFAWL
ncbi:hypothetical protein CC78DRAFT_528486 [Lojkania enalia]|uniref:Uncharacterized protein n=1 Tax=Lojkania enalia TaxID=147567 RepID=A0A9P4NCJ2_9PLEO|nr:hypothetical protein CC78DRAFT_528486 [Didymosphaeria enalia]